MPAKRPQRLPGHDGAARDPGRDRLSGQPDRNLLKVYATRSGVVVQASDRWYRARDFSFDALFRERAPLTWLRKRLAPAAHGVAEIEAGALPPIESQEIWAAGVTYQRSRKARMEESSRDADAYDRVYRARRPELFFKANRRRTVGDGAEVTIRSDSSWDVPEAELALAINCHGRIFGYSIGNDVSSRSIEGENPLYLPQAKIYDGSCALGPCLLLSDAPLAPATDILLRIVRRATSVFEGSTRLSNLKRKPAELVDYLFRDNSFPDGCYLLTGTGIVPPGEFTLAPDDEIAITIEPVGTLRNKVRRARGRPTR